jgi:hypothetical protein
MFTILLQSARVSRESVGEEGSKGGTARVGTQAGFARGLPSAGATSIPAVLRMRRFVAEHSGDA